MNFFCRNIILINVFILSLCKYAYSDEQKIINSLSACADYNYSRMDFSKLDEKTYENDVNYIELKKKLDLLGEKREKLSEIYRLEIEKYKEENPEPVMKKYTKKEWEYQTSWITNKNKALSSFKSDIDKIVIEINNFKEIVSEDIREVIFNYLENTSDEFKIKNVNGYSDRFRNCEGNYNHYPISFMLQWSKSS